MRLTSSAGPVLLMLGVAGVLGILMLPPDERGTLGWWILSNAFAYQRVLPLAGLGLALAFVSPSQRRTAFFLFALGMALGFIFADPFLSTVALLPGAARSHFLVAPIMSVAVGLSLASPGWIRRSVLPVAAIITGAVFAIAIWLTDPSFRDLTITLTGIGVGFWILLAVCLTVRQFWQTWFEIAGRILGSWLIAIGLLYGGVSLMPPRELPLPDGAEFIPPPSNQLMGSDQDTGFPDQSNPLPSPEELDPSRQP